MLHILKPLLHRPLMPLLVILQVALACAIACNALFLLQQKLGPILAPNGVSDSSHLIVLSQIIPKGKPWSAARMRVVQADLRAVPGVKAATYADAFPMVDTSYMAAHVFGNEDTQAKIDTAVYLGNNLLDTIGLHLVAGRNFTSGEESVNYGSGMGFHTAGPVIITRALADRLFPDGHALGQIIRYSNSPGGARTVIGVVANLMRSRFTQDNRNLEYTMLFPGMAARWPMSVFAARVATHNAWRACKPLKAVIQRDLGARLLPGTDVECELYSTLRDQTLAPQRAAVWLLSGVTMIVLMVTLTGIAGMTGYWVQQRTRSIGVRRALGAQRSDILRELLIENLVVVGAGVVMGLIAAYGINLWLMRHYELLRLPWTYLPFGAALLLVLGQIAVLAPARRASNIPPIVATRAA